MRRPVPRRVARPLAGVTVACGLTLLTAACAFVGPRPLDVLPGHRAVLGRIDLSRFEAPEALLVIVRDDGTYRHDLRAGLGGREFAISLPPGRYRIESVRLVDDRRPSPSYTVRRVSVGFEVSRDPFVYVGTLRLVSVLGPRLTVEVADEYEDTMQILRGRYRGLDGPVARSLLTHP